MPPFRIPGMPVYEAVPEPEPAAPSEPAPEPSEPAPEPAEPTAPEGEPAGEPDYEAMLRSEEGQQYLQQAVYEAMQGYNPEEYADFDGGYGQEPQDPLSDFDFLADDAPQQLAQILEQRDQRLFEMFQSSPVMQHAAEQQQAAWATEQFSGIEQSLGTQVPQELREISIAMAAGSRPPDGHPSARYFEPGRALAEATSTLHTLIQREREAAVRDYQNGVTGTPTAGATEPSAAGPAPIESESVPSNMREARERWERREGLRQ